MPVNFDPDEFDSALRQLSQPRTVRTPPQASTTAQNADDWHQSEAFQVRIITARTKLKLMRDRSDALRDSLQRFRTRQERVNGA